MLFEASAPGSLMLLGEYSVLENGHALVCAVDKRIKVSLSPRSDSKISIVSQLGKYTGDLTTLSVEPPFQFVTSTLLRSQSFFKTGFDLTIESEFSNQLGFGSSAAVVVATLGVLNSWLQKPLDSLDLIRQARAIVQQVQGVGSGADVAACVLGGVIAYKRDPMIAEKLPYDFPITVVYSGSKTPTAQAIQHVLKSFSTRPAELQHLYKKIGECAFLGMNAIHQKNWTKLGSLMNEQQGYMDKLGVTNSVLNEIIQALKQSQSILGTKISGSGLGDCVVAMGKLDENIHFENEKIQLISTSISQKGLEFAA